MPNPIVAAAGVAGASLLGSKMTGDKIESGAQSQAEAQRYAIQMQQLNLNRTRRDIKGAVKSGKGYLNSGYNSALNTLNPMSGLDELDTARDLMNDPSAIMDRPSTQFIYGEGIEAMQGAFSKTSGGGLSGAAIKASQRYGQNLASMQLDAEMGRLFNFINLGERTRGKMAGLYEGKGKSKANLEVGGASGVSSITGQMTPGIAAGINNMGTIGANEQYMKANNATNLLQNATNIGGQFGNYMQMNPGLFSSTPAPNVASIPSNFHYGGR